MTDPISRRQWLGQTMVTGGAVWGAAGIASTQAASTDESTALRYCLNTSTIRGQNLSVEQQIDVAAQAGYDGIEPWMRDLHAYVEQGGKPATLRRRLEDAGLTVDSAIGFAHWIVDDAQERAAGLETMKRDMDLLRQIGGTRIAAPPVGATDRTDLDLRKAAERYHELLQLGVSLGVIPQLELWGFSKTLSRLGELMFVAVECGHPQACVLPDVYHIYKGGSDFTGLQMIHGGVIHVFHMNDYPAIPRETIGDADRVYPGDGVAPLDQILNMLTRNRFRGTLSLELFNRQYWSEEALQVARTGLEKMKAAVAASQA